MISGSYVSKTDSINIPILITGVCIFGICLENKVVSGKFTKVER